ncbi:ankyrin repeat-containing domain protein [Xylaria sp. FL0043]|nr:ankyrin repeat-containing domain protein [Xylaria sp. FL0043]
MSGSSATAAAHEAYEAPNSSDDVSKTLDDMNIQVSTGLSMLPPEILVDILGELPKKRDWLALAKTCRGVSGVAAAELRKYSLGEGRDCAFWHACVTGKADLVQRHIAHDATVVNQQLRPSYNVRGRIGSQLDWLITPLAVAIIAGKDDIVQQLLDNGADANLPDETITLSEYLVPRYPLLWAVISKHKRSVAIIKMLTDHSADVNRLPDSWDRKIASLDHNYPRYELCVVIFQVLQLEQPSRSSMRCTRRLTSCEQYNRDFKKIQNLRLRQLKALLCAGANPNTPHNWEAVTPIFFLLDSVASYEPSFYFSDSLIVSDEEEVQATMLNDIAISFLDVLRDFGADVRRLGNTFFYKNKMGRTFSPAYREMPLHAACRLKDRHKPLIYWFLRNGAHIDDVGGDGNTPLMVYCGSRFQSVDQFQEFLSCGPEVNRRDKDGRTALHHLCANRWLQPLVMENAVSMMLGAGADPTAISDQALVPAQEIDLKNGPYDSVAEMLREAYEEWKQLDKERERRLFYGVIDVGHPLASEEVIAETEAVFEAWLNPFVAEVTVTTPAKVESEAVIQAHPKPTATKVPGEVVRLSAKVMSKVNKTSPQKSAIIKNRILYNIIGPSIEGGSTKMLAAADNTAVAIEEHPKGAIEEGKGTV